MVKLHTYITAYLNSRHLWREREPNTPDKPMTVEKPQSVRHEELKKGDLVKIKDPPART